MENIQEIFNRIQEKKSKQREIKGSYKDALANSSEYQDIKNKLESIKSRKKEVEEKVKYDFKEEFNRLERIKTDIESDNILLSDIALNHVVKGKLIEITDTNQNRYEPLFSVKFRKI